MAFLPTNTHSKPTGKIESCGGHSSSSSWPGHWILRPWLLDKTIISRWLNHLIPSSLSYQAQSPYLPHGGGVDVHFSGAVDCFRQIVKAQGVLGLWNGLAANLLKVRGMVSLPLVRLCHCHPVLHRCHSLCSLPANTSSSTEPVSAGWLSALKSGDPVRCWDIWYPIPEELSI